MCRSVHALLTESERTATARMWGVMIPIYASIGLFILATLAFNAGSRDSQMMAAASDAAPASAQAPR